MEGGDFDVHQLTSKDSPRGSVDSDEYVEYVVTFADFPNTVEEDEEERVNSIPFRLNSH